MKRISRRDIMKTLAAAGAGVAAGGLLSAPAVGKEPGRVISGPVQSTSKVALPNIADRNVDFDGDGSVDYQIQTRLLVTKYTGVMEGYATVLVTCGEDLQAKIAPATLTATFWGTVGDSEPGAMTFTGTLVSDRRNPAEWVISSRLVVVEGTGSGGLEGVTGYGVAVLKGPPVGPFLGDQNWAFRFGNASGVAFLASP
jgi:hypothetical protein